MSIKPDIIVPIMFITKEMMLRTRETIEKDQLLAIKVKIKNMK
jgi:hypothetical protein